MSSDPSTPLFRQAALDALAPRQHGDVVLVPGQSSRWMAWSAWALLAGLLALLLLGSYTRRSTVSGVLMPAAGLIRLVAPQPGVVIEAPVREGQIVKKGDVLFVLSDDRAGSEGEGYQQDVAARITARRDSLQDDLRRVQRSEQDEAAQIGRRVESLRAEKDRAQRQLSQMEARVRSADEALQRYRALFAQGFVSRDELLARETSALELQGQLDGLRRELLSLDRQQSDARREADALRTRQAIQRGELERAVLQAGQEYTEVEARRRVVVRAPADGQVTLMRAQVGQSVAASRALAHLVPGSSALVARLYAPSRAVGFVRQGQPVLLRYDAFPYQKFGQQSARVLSVSGAAATAAELDEVAIVPEWANEPLFAITVALPPAAQSDVGVPLALQAGMRVEADVLHESRRLIEWILEPLYAVKARMRND